MTTDDLRRNWLDYGVSIDNKTHHLSDIYSMCWGFVEDWGGLIFDTGNFNGEAHCFIVENDCIISVNPLNHAEKQVIGPLVDLKKDTTKV